MKILCLLQRVSKLILRSVLNVYIVSFCLFIQFPGDGNSAVVPISRGEGYRFLCLQDTSLHSLAGQHFLLIVDHAGRDIYLILAQTILRAYSRTT